MNHNRLKLKNKAVTLFVILTIGSLFFLPNHTIDPWNLFNPKIFIILLVTIAAIQLCGYLAIRLFGQYFGLAIN